MEPADDTPTTATPAASAADSDPPLAATPGRATEAGGTTEVPEATEAAGATDVFVVGAVDYAYEDVPATLAVGSRLDIDNRSDLEVHEIVVFRLPDQEARSADALVALPQDELSAIIAGPPTTVLVQGPGGPAIAAVGDGTLGEPGRYLLFCAIPVGADPEEYLTAAAAASGPVDVPGGPPHFTRGMVAELRVV